MLPVLLFNVISGLVIDRAQDLAKDHVEDMIDSILPKDAKKEFSKKDASWRFSKLSGLRFLAWLNSLGNGEADRAMKEMYLYASSQTDKSSVFYKVY